MDLGEQNGPHAQIGIQQAETLERNRAIENSETIKPDNVSVESNEADDLCVHSKRLTDSQSTIVSVPVKSGSVPAKKSSKPMKQASAAQNVEKNRPSKGPADGKGEPLRKENGVGIPTRNPRVMKSADVHSGTLKQHQKPQSINFTVPQPFALATDRRASLGGQMKSLNRDQVVREDENRTNGGKGDDLIESDNHHEAARSEEAKSQIRSSANTFSFNSDVRAQRRKEFNSKVEEKLTAKEAERTQAQAKTKEEIQAEIKKFRKSLTFKATPMPSFYQSAPPKLEIRKIPPTRAISPKLGRRNSNGFASCTEPKSTEELNSSQTSQSIIESNGTEKFMVKTKKSHHSLKKPLNSGDLNGLANGAVKPVSSNNGLRKIKVAHDVVLSDCNTLEVDVTSIGQSNASGFVQA